MRLTMKTRNELTDEVSKRYKKVRKLEKKIILDEYCQTTGYNRKYAGFLLRNCGKKIYLKNSSGKLIKVIGDNKVKKNRLSKKKIYDDKVLKYIILFWETLQYCCGKRLKSCLDILINKAKQFNEIYIPEDVESKLRKISAATIDRMLKDERKRYELKGRSRTKPGTLLKKQIPIRNGNEWDENKVGFVEIDLVSHDGGNVTGDFCYTLNIVDIKSGWTELVAVKNKAQIWVFDAIKNVQNRLPFILRGIDSDNGSEFINAHLYRYCVKNNIIFTRSRPYYKNDNCHVEQKNFTAVRNYAGYNRYDTDKELFILNELYFYLDRYLNFFQPQMKLIEKKRIGSKMVKKYDNPQTPYQRLLLCEEINDEKKKELKLIYEQLNPFEINRNIIKIQKKLYDTLTYKRKKSEKYDFIENEVKISQQSGL